MTCRLIGGGALVLAGFMKLRDPSVFMLSIESFGLIPESLIPLMAFILPWTEIVSGLLLVYGLWSRAAGVIATALYGIFILALLWVLWKDLPVDCGCFGGLFGSETVGWGSILRNIVLASAAVAVTFCGGGAASLDAVRGETIATAPAKDKIVGLAGQEAS